MCTALQVLLDQSTKANSPLKGHERTVQYLQRLGKGGGGISPPGLLQQTVLKYFQCLGVFGKSLGENVSFVCAPNTGGENLGIILEFSPWVLKICPEDGLKVKTRRALH